jgi:hypothetical protein
VAHSASGAGGEQPQTAATSDERSSRRRRTAAAPGKRRPGHPPPAARGGLYGLAFPHAKRSTSHHVPGGRELYCRCRDVRRSHNQLIGLDVETRTRRGPASFIAVARACTMSARSSGATARYLAGRPSNHLADHGSGARHPVPPRERDGSVRHPRARRRR